MVFIVVFRTLNAPAFSRSWPLVLGTEHCQRSQQSSYDKILVHNSMDQREPLHLHQRTIHLHFQSGILVLIDFQDLEQLAHRGDARSGDFDLFDTHNYEHCSPIEIRGLFTWSRQFLPDEARLCVLSGLCGLVSLLMWERWDIEVPSDQLEPL